MVACEDLARGAGAILKDMFGKPRQVQHKGVVDLVTDADHASEAFLLAEVQRRFPHHAILAEESGTQGPADAPLVWVMDPLDGTTNYAHGFPYFNVSVAVCLPTGMPLAGCVVDPTRDEWFVAAAGQGAWRVAGTTRTRLQVSACQELQQALLVTGFPYDRALHADNNITEHRELSMRCQGVRRNGAAALDLCNVAAGRLDGYWEAHLKRWDVAAGALMVLEAGGLVTGYDGQAFNGTQSCVVAAGRPLHPALLQLVAHARRDAGFPVFPERTRG